MKTIRITMEIFDFLHIQYYVLYRLESIRGLEVDRHNDVCVQLEAAEARIASSLQVNAGKSLKHFN